MLVAFPGSLWLLAHSGFSKGNGPTTFWIRMRSTGRQFALLGGSAKRPPLSDFWLFCPQIPPPPDLHRLFRSELTRDFQ